jgi:putative hydrolase of the HAD superfamily
VLLVAVHCYRFYFCQWRIPTEKGRRLFIISNGFRERGEYYKKNFSFLGESLGDIFEKIYFSYNTGYKKPDPKFFELILTENNLDPKECLYFDDSEKNILSAKTLGINGIVFKDNNSVKEAIKDF